MPRVETVLRAERGIDQAAGLRRLFAPQPPAVLAVVAGAGMDATLAGGLAAAAQRAGEEVLVVDATPGNVAAALGVPARYELAHVLRAEKTLEEVVLAAPEGCAILPARRGLAVARERAATLAAALAPLAGAADRVMVALPPGSAAAGDPDHVVVVPVAAGRDGITSAYGEIKLRARRAHRFAAIVHGVAGEGEGRAVYAALAAAAQRFLGLRVELAGAVPRDAALDAALERGRPVHAIDPDAPSARALDAALFALAAPARLH